MTGHTGAASSLVNATFEFGLFANFGERALIVVGFRRFVFNRARQRVRAPDIAALIRATCLVPTAAVTNPAAAKFSRAAPP